MPKTEPPRVAVLGAGPVGLEAALYARTLGLPVAVYERGQVAEHLQRWGHVKLFSPFGMNVSPLGLQTLLREKPTRTFPGETDVVTGRQLREAYHVPLAESTALLESVHTQTAVLHVGRSFGFKKSDGNDGKRPFRLLVRDAKGQERIETADVVLDCTGTYAYPNWIGDGNTLAVGELAARPHVSHGIEDILGEKRDHYAGKSIVLIGDGYSAATTICNLATLAEEHSATWVIWLTRGQRGQPLPRVTNDPLKERDRLAVKANSLAMRCDGNLEFHPQTLVDELISHGPNNGFRVAGRTNGKPASWDVERVISCVGYRADLGICSGLRVDDPVGRFETREPGYYVLGSKSHGRNSSFLLRDGFEQVRGVFAAIMGNPRLDLYARKAA